MSEKNESTISLEEKKKKGVKINTDDLQTNLTDEQDKKVNTRRNKDGWNQRKLYEVMLLEEIPETQRPNEPTHAVLEGELGKWDVDGQSNYSVRNQALIHYIADLANSNDADDTFDYEFVASLLRNGADINCMDPTGQTIFHEVSRSWNTDVAKFLVEHGANVNHQDEFGRSPLHVAAAVDYADMVEFILQHGGDIDIKTKGEEQTAIHYAAKNDAVNSIQMLLGYGANINARDSRNRTPLQVSAEMNRFKAAKLLVTEGAPAGVYDDHGNSALSLLIEKIPEVALIALDQLHTTDYINRREFYFLNYLEGAKLKEELQDTAARSPLEIAVQNQRFDIIMHPVMHRLIAVKWKIYGKKGAILDLVLNLIYTILWTVESVSVPQDGHELYTPLKENIWRLAINGFIILFTLIEIKRQVVQMVYARRALVKWREWRVEQLQQDKQYCHPRWPQESKYLDSEIRAVKGLHFVSSSDNWIYFDWFCLFAILAAISTNVLFFFQQEIIWKEVNNHTSFVMLLILWLRMFKYARPFENAGPFVVIFSNVVGDILKWFVLNAIIVIPFACGFWIEFGGNSMHPAEGYTDVPSLLFNIFQMMIIGDYSWPNLVTANETLARIMSMSFIMVVGIITLNLLIALVSNTFERHYENAVANAVMQRAGTILMLQSRMAKKKLRRYYEFIKNNASPQVIVQSKYGRLMTASSEDRASLDRVYDDIREIKSVLAERFGRSYGKGNKSDLETILEDLGKVKRSGKELAKDIKNVKLILYGIGGQPVSPLYKENLCRMSSGEGARNRQDDDDESDKGMCKTRNKNNNTNNVTNSNNNNNNNNNNDDYNNNNNNINNNNNNHDNYNNSNNDINNNNHNNDNYNNGNKNNDNNNFNYDITPYPTTFPSLPNVQMPPVPIGFDNIFRPRKTRKRNQSRRSKKPKSSSSESSDYDDPMMTGPPGAPYPFQGPRYYPNHVDSPRKWKGPYNRRSSPNPVGEDSRNRGNYYHLSPNEYHRDRASPSSEGRYLEPQHGEPHTPIHMYPSDHGSTVRPVYQVTPPTPYHTNMSPIPARTREFPGRWSGQQPAQPAASVYQQPPGLPTRRFTYEYGPQSDDANDHHGYKRLSRTSLSPLDVQRSNQGSEYSDSDMRQQKEENQQGRTSRSETPRSDTASHVRIADEAERKDEGEVSNKRESASSATSNVEQSKNVETSTKRESSC